jgi:nucleotide-binding universal stress UspA family protein
MYTKILVPLDGSAIAEQVLPHACSLAGTLSLPVELLHAVDPQTIETFTDPRHGRYVDMVEADFKEKGLDYLKKFEDSFPKASKIVCSVEIGKPADVIVAKAAAQPATLITMSTHGRSGIQRWLLGSVAEKVLQMTTNHLLLVRGDKENKTVRSSLKTVVVPLDGSSLAEKALPCVREIAKKMDLEVLLLRVYAVPVMAFTGEDYYAPNLEMILQEAKDEAKRYLEQKVNQLKREGLQRVSSRLLEGEIANQIIDFARKTPDNLIAMCSHGRSGIGRLVLGSVTSRVVRYSGDPVLVVRASAGT